MSSITSISNSNSTTLASRDGSQVSQPLGVAEVAPPKNVQPAELTWAEMQRAFLADLKEQGKGSQEKNFRTTFKFFIEAVGKTDDSPVGEELAEGFEAKLVDFVELQKKRGCMKGTYKPRISKMRKIKQFAENNFASTLALQTLPKIFGKRLLMLITAAGHTVKSFWCTLPKGLISYPALCRWCNGAILPDRKNAPRVIEVIEDSIGVAAGTLRLPLYCQRAWNQELKSSDYSNKLRAVKLKPYAKVTGVVLEELRGLSSYKTLAILLEDDEDDYDWLWTISEGGGLPTAKIVGRIVGRFMGFCALSSDSSDPYLKGIGISDDNLSLALLADKELMKGFIQFMTLRSGLRIRPTNPATLDSVPAHELSADKKWEFYDIGGKYNSWTLRFLDFVLSLLRPGSGYLYRHPEFAEKLGARMTAATWQEQCVRTRGVAKKLFKKILKLKKEGDRNQYDFGRDPSGNIQWILDLKRPLTILHDMVKAMLEDLLPESATRLARARQYRDIILIALLCANPLRIRMFSIMEFGKHLVRRDDGSWWLHFKKGAFKNRKALKSNYNVRVAEHLWPLLDTYKEEFHPVLVGSSQSKYVFPTSIKSATKGAGSQMCEDTLSKIVEMMTGLYIPDSEGFRPHAFRHIIATDIIKKDPRLGFFVAARALHDKLETVEEMYAHLKTSEFFEPVNAHLAEMWTAVFGARQSIEIFSATS